MNQYTFYGMMGLIISLPIMMIVMIVYAYYDERNHPDDYKYTLRYDNQILKCKVEMPSYVDGKMSRWTGSINLTYCSNGKEYFGATNVEVLARPKCSCR